MKKTEAIEATRVMCRRERLAAIRDRLAKASPYPWEKCTAHDGRCSCPMIWSVEADAPVVDVLKKWGDGVEGSDSWSEYGRWTEEAFQANKEFIANAPTDIAFLLAEVERLAAVILSAVETLKAPNPAIADTAKLSDAVGATIEGTAAETDCARAAKQNAKGVRE